MSIQTIICSKCNRPLQVNTERSEKMKDVREFYFTFECYCKFKFSVLILYTDPREKENSYDSQRWARR